MIDKKTRIMDAAERLFTSGQFHEITLDDVSRLADVGKGTIYHYFANKDDLFFQTAVAAFDRLCELLRQDVESAGPVEKDLRRACEAISKFVEEHRPLFRLMHAEAERTLSQGGALRQRWNQHRKELTQAVAEIIRKGVRLGEVRKDIMPNVLAEYFLGMLRTKFNELEGLGARARDNGTLIALFVHGLSGNGGRRDAAVGNA